MLHNDALPSLKPSPKMGLGFQNAEMGRLEGTLPTLNTRRGRGGVLSLWDQTRKRDKLLSYQVLHPKPTTRWLELILHLFGVGTSHGQPWTHLIHHDPDSGEATTFPHIVYSALFRGGHIRMAFCPGTPKVESRNCQFDSRTLFCP